MKKVLFAGLLVLAGVSVSAQNLIKNEKFATEVKTKVTNANKATAGDRKSTRLNSSHPK